MTVAEKVAELCGIAVKSSTSLGTSHAWTLHRILLEDGRSAFVKAALDSAALDSAAVYEAEAYGLRWLESAAGGVPVPPVLGVGHGMLVLGWVESSSASASAAAGFGRSLAITHRSGAPAFGASWPGWIATLPLDNAPGESWPSWYGLRRLLPYARIARDAGTLSRSDVALIEEVIERLPALAGPEEAPARIHGDCWSGNILWTSEGGVLIDPAAHGGHRETDLAMLALFGAPHLARIISAYQDEHPLADGWRARIPLHQLHPLLVHVCLFGESYRGSLLSAAGDALAAQDRS